MARMIYTAFLHCVKWREGSQDVDDGVEVKRTDVEFLSFSLRLWVEKCSDAQSDHGSSSRVRLTKASLCAALRRK